MNAMKRAWEIRKEAAKRWNCTVSEIVFSECLKMAYAGQSVPQGMFTNEEIETIQNRVKKVAFQGSRPCHPERVAEVMSAGWENIEVGTITWKDGNKTYAKADKNSVINHDGVKMEMNDLQKRNMVVSYAMICGLA